MERRVYTPTPGQPLGSFPREKSGARSAGETIPERHGARVVLLRRKRASVAETLDPPGKGVGRATDPVKSSCGPNSRDSGPCEVIEPHDRPRVGRFYLQWERRAVHLSATRCLGPAPNFPILPSGRCRKNGGWWWWWWYLEELPRSCSASQ